MSLRPFAHPKRRASRLAALVVVLVLIAAPTAAASARVVSLVERFSGPKLAATRWRKWWGSARVAGHALTIASLPPTTANETHSSLVTTRATWRDFRASVGINPLRQLRRNALGNTWETGWVFFRFRDLSNYYYFILKPNGWELGKKQGSDAQIFLATGESPRLPILGQAHVTIVARGARIEISVDGVPVVDFTDPNPLLAKGSLGLYEEDSAVRFTPLTVVSLQS